jgi:hypothetical protein
MVHVLHVGWRVRVRYRGWGSNDMVMLRVSVRVSPRVWMPDLNPYLNLRPNPYRNPSPNFNRNPNL